MSSKETTILKVRAERPDVEQDWLIFNAPRPLYGHKEWQGDFLHGVFYAAVDRHGDRAAWMVRENCMLDGWILEHIDEQGDTLAEYAKGLAAQYGCTMERLFELENDEDIWTMYMNHHGRREISVDALLAEVECPACGDKRMVDGGGQPTPETGTTTDRPCPLCEPIYTTQVQGNEPAPF